MPVHGSIAEMTTDALKSRLIKDQCAAAGITLPSGVLSECGRIFAAKL